MSLVRRAIGRIRRSFGYRPATQITVPMEWHGSHYGGWHVYPRPLDSSSIVCSFGVGEDISFDLSLIGKYGLTVYAFDPTPKSIAWLRSQSLPANFHFWEYGLAANNCTAAFFPPDDETHVSHTILQGVRSSGKQIEVEMHSLARVIHDLGLNRIDILKMDIEGAEYGVIDNLEQSNIPIAQIMVEFHHRFPAVGIGETRKAIRKLAALGYKLFWISDTGEEFSFVHKSVL